MAKHGYSAIFDSAYGQTPYGKRTICEVHCELYDLCVQALHPSNPEMLRRIVTLLEEAYGMGKKMNGKLVEHKAGMDGWAATYTPSEYATKQASRKSTSTGTTAAVRSQESRSDPGEDVEQGEAVDHRFVDRAARMDTLDDATKK